MITRDEAKQKITAILSKNAPIKTGQTLPVRRGETFNVYRIPLELLVPNRLNDRISWRIREIEAENGRQLNLEDDIDVELLYSLIIKEHPNENNRTLSDLALN